MNSKSILSDYISLKFSFPPIIKLNNFIRFQNNYIYIQIILWILQRNLQ